MINVQAGGQHVSVVPRVLQDMIAKQDYIKERRPSPFSMLRDLPKDITEKNYKIFVETSMKIAMQMSSVTMEEELYFDSSFEGYYYTVWQGCRASLKWSADSRKGINTAKAWYSGLEESEQQEVRLALAATDQRSLAKNSDGPVETTTGQDENQESKSET